MSLVSHHIIRCKEQFNHEGASTRLNTDKNGRGRLAVAAKGRPLILVNLHSLLRLLSRNNAILRQHTHPSIVRRHTLTAILYDQTLQIRRVNRLTYRTRVLILTLRMRIMQNIITIMNKLRLITIGSRMILHTFLLLCTRFSNTVRTITLMRTTLSRLNK